MTVTEHNREWVKQLLDVLYIVRDDATSLIERVESFRLYGDELEAACESFADNLSSIARVCEQLADGTLVPHDQLEETSEECITRMKAQIELLTAELTAAGVDVTNTLKALNQQ